MALDADSGDIIAHIMTDQNVSDASQVQPLLDKIDRPICQFTADGAYDGEPNLQRGRQTQWQRGGRYSATRQCVGAAGQPSPQRERHIAAINVDGRMKWQIASGYGKRFLVETVIGRYKSIIRPRLRSRLFAARRTEVAIGWPP